MKKIAVLTLLAVQLLGTTFAQSPQVKTANGILEGIDDSGIRTFKGIPFAAPPLGDLRWKEPQPVKNWDGIRKADKFGPRAMQRAIFGDMGFRSNGMSEDCLYLNVWTPALSSNEHLPVLVYFYGGGFAAGDGSEYRYDGESMARKGIVSVTVNYRLSIFGFMAHPELTKESPHHASGNYGLLDQAAALQWVSQNIIAFGGDPKHVTIAGESAGSYSVSAQMASPLSRKLIAGAIGESGSLMGTNPTTTLAQGEQKGIKFAELAGAKSLADLRKLSADKLVEVGTNHEFELFPVVVDGYFFPQEPAAIFEAGQQAHVPLLVGWNSEEMNFRAFMGQDAPTMENFTKAVQKAYGSQAAEVLKVYNPSSDKEVEQVATDLSGDRFIGFSTWKWSDLHVRTGGSSVYRYFYARPRPAMRAEMGNAVAGLAGGIVKDASAKKAPAATGAVHSSEIEYAMGNLPTNRTYDWQPEDYKVSEIMQSYFVNFIKTGNPAGLALPAWSAVKSGSAAPVMHIDVNTRVEIEKSRDRYLLLEKLSKK
ncbi:MAG TPA: carboxylesterase [Prolixibacteraceae bacterium]|jgi:para-nitrobenzyl esterase|nr:carboxylesterase [Prolixibacteraceae bacterium]